MRQALDLVPVFVTATKEHLVEETAVWCALFMHDWVSSSVFALTFQELPIPSLPMALTLPERAVPAGSVFSLSLPN